MFFHVSDKKTPPTGQFAYQLKAYKKLRIRINMQFSLVIISLICINTASAQIKNVLISNVSDPEEATIAINPKNTQQIIAGANMASYYYSHDGGTNWTRQVLKCEKYNVYGDPLVFWDTLQHAYFMHLSFPNKKITPDGSWVDRIVVNKSTDFGKTYPVCYAFGKNGSKVQDKHWAVVNPYNNEIHVTWTQFDKYESKNPADSSTIRYSKSTDGGVNWTEPLRISYFAGDCRDSDNTVEGAVPCVGPNGQIYVAWAGPKGLVFNKSMNGGKTWLPKELIIDSIPGGWEYTIEGVFRANGLPFTACDNSNGPHRGRIYVCWSDERFGIKNKDVFMIYSDDSGETWSNRILITYYPNHKHQFMPHFTIDQTNGYLYFLYYDRRNFAEGNKTDVYLSVSRDGGLQFVHHKINEQTFTPDKTVFFGDYIGVSAHHGVIRPMWMAMDDNKKLSVYTALLNDSLLKQNTEEKALTIDKTGFYQYADKTTLRFLAEKPGVVSAWLYKATDSGFEKCAIKERKFNKGKNELIINFKKLKLPRDTYVIVLYSNNIAHEAWIQSE